MPGVPSVIPISVVPPSADAHFVAAHVPDASTRRFMALPPNTALELTPLRGPEIAPFLMVRIGLK